MSKKSLVALAHGLDVQENVTRVFDMMGGAAKMIEPNSTVVLKPNAGHAAPPEFAVCTHPETVRAVIREVKKANPKRIVIAEAAAVGCDTLALDAFGVKRFISHEILLGQGIPIMENLCNLGKLPPFCAVLGLQNKFKGGSGSPIRLVAFVQ